MPFFFGDKVFALTAAFFAATPIGLGANGFDLSDSLVPELDIAYWLSWRALHLDTVVFEAGTEE